MSGSGWPGCGAKAGEGVREVGGPGPVAVDLELPGSSGADEAGGDVKEPVTQRWRFAAGQFAIQAERLVQVSRSAAVRASSSQTLFCW